MPSNEPPWKIIIIPGFDDRGLPISWVIFRVHYLLISNFTLSHLPTSFPNPWSAITVPARSPILSSPSMIAKISHQIINAMIQFLKKIIHFKQFYREIKQIYYEFELKGFLISILKCFLSFQMWNALYKCIVEIIWILRGFLSLPRLIIEEYIATRQAQVIDIWKKRRKISTKTWNRAVVGWSEEVPLIAAKGIKNAKGVSISTILMTALTGSFRDLLRTSGQIPPDYLRCSLPIYIPSKLHCKGLLPLPLSVGASDSQKALALMTKAIQKLKNYPERWVVWVRLTPTNELSVFEKRS